MKYKFIKLYRVTEQSKTTCLLKIKFHYKASIHTIVEKLSLLFMG